MSDEPQVLDAIVASVPIDVVEQMRVRVDSVHVQPHQPGSFVGPAVDLDSPIAVALPAAGQVAWGDTLAFDLPEQLPIAQLEQFKQLLLREIEGLDLAAGLCGPNSRFRHVARSPFQI